MLLKNRSKKTALMKYGLIAPLFLLMIVLASATVIDKKGLENTAESVEVPLTGLPSINDLSLLSIENDKQTNLEIEGYVKSSDGKVLPEAIITVKGTRYGTMTDRNGHFKLNVNDNNTTLIISFAGSETREIRIDGITEVMVKLVNSQNMLDEMGVVSARNANQEVIFTTVEEQPEFPGGVEKMYEYIGQNLVYPKTAQRDNIQGKVFVKFVVTKYGDIGQIKTLKGIGYGCEEEVARILANMPTWKPGEQDGEKVNVYFTMPIAFRLE
jgi:TonB family protein